MILLNIFDIKKTMAYLLLRDTFDQYLLEEATVTTFATLKISGRRNAEWYDTDGERWDVPELLRWGEAKPFFYEYIKGKKTPSCFQVSLKLTGQQTEKMDGLQGLGKLMCEKRTDVLLHFRFEKGRLIAVTGTSSHEFTMDQSVGQAWDSTLKELFWHTLGIGCEEG